MKIYDYLVIGSGCAGAMAAQTLVEAGVNVGMLDVGDQNKDYPTIVPDQDYLSIRKTDLDQHKYLIGDNGEGISWGKMGKGAQVTPPRKNIDRLSSTFIPSESDNFSPLESLAYGGLGMGWGLQCWEYSRLDLKQTGLSLSQMSGAYETVSKRVGISATKDEAAKYTLGNLKTYQPSPFADRNHDYIYSNYKKHINKFKKDGAFIGRTPLALITEDTNGRRGYEYKDMDYYTDNGESAWRPWITINTLRKRSNFEYVNNILVTSFEEKDNIVTITGLNIKTRSTVKFSCKKLLLACGALGSGRIVLRSLGNDDSKLPMLCNPHAYIPLLQPKFMGKGSEKRKLGLGQLSYFIDPEGDDSNLSVASSYGYQSLMLFRLINQVPLNFYDARLIMRYLMPGIIVMIVQHPDNFSDEKYIKLEKDASSPTGDKLFFKYQLSKDIEKQWNKREKKYVSLMRSLNTYALKTVHTAHGSSIHYAGTLPFSGKAEDFHLTLSGRLHGTKHVYVADSSGFNYLPAKGLTFSLMANAHLTAEGVLKNA